VTVDDGALVITWEIDGWAMAVGTDDKMMVYGKFSNDATTGETHEFGTTTVDGTETNDGMVTTIELGMLATTSDGTLAGTFSHEIMTTLGWDEMVMKADDGTPDNHETGMATGETHDSGTATVDTTETTETIFELGIEAMTTDGMLLGTFSHEMMTTLG
jgi:hypothetical protein